MEHPHRSLGKLIPGRLKAQFVELTIGANKGDRVIPRRRPFELLGQFRESLTFFGCGLPCGAATDKTLDLTTRF